MEIEDLDVNCWVYATEASKIKNTLNFAPRIIFDIGANVGGFSVQFSKEFPQATIYSFEPVKRTFEFLKENTKDLKNVHIFNFGLSDKNQENIPIGMPSIPVKIKHNYGRATTIYEGEPIDYVKMIRISEWCTQNLIFPDFLKIDVEGDEYKILKDLDDILLDSVRAIYIEINNSPCTKESAQMSKEFLLNHFTISGNSGVNTENGEPLNYIFCKTTWL